MSDVRAFRMCHVCDHLSEGGRGLTRCAGCGRYFAPFYYYDDRRVAVVDVDRRLAKPVAGEWAPIRGLTAYWSALD